MSIPLSKFIQKFIFKKWTIGLSRCNIEDIIRNKTFDPDIKWLVDRSFEKFQADPFPLVTDNGEIKILLEEFSQDLQYGTISLLTLNQNFSHIGNKKLLDTNSHLSYPFTFSDGNRIYVFPESKQNGKLSCYEYDQKNESLNFLQDIINLPLLDSTILKHNGKYWVFGALANEETGYELNVFYSDDILGPYNEHAQNPIKTGLDATRPAGHFIIVDGNIFRPTQNCKNEYGESITINRVTKLSETSVIEEPYMNICINIKNKHNRGIHTIHTINAMNNILIVDGIHWTFSPFHKLKKFIKDFRKRRQLKKEELL